MKYHIEKNTVQETLVIPLYGRVKCSELYPNLYKDDEAKKIIDNLDYDFSKLEEKKRNVSILLFRGSDEIIWFYLGN